MYSNLCDFLNAEKQKYISILKSVVHIYFRGHKELFYFNLIQISSY